MGIRQKLVQQKGIVLIFFAQIELGKKKIEEERRKRKKKKKKRRRKEEKKRRLSQKGKGFWFDSCKMVLFLGFGWGNFS